MFCKYFYEAITTHNIMGLKSFGEISCFLTVASCFKSGTKDEAKSSSSMCEHVDFGF